MAKKFSDADQDSYVTQGLALGVLSHNVGGIPADKLAFEFALSHAWRSFPSAGLFPRVMSDHRADAYYLLNKSEGRRGPLIAAWRKAKRGWEPYVWNDGWTVEETGQMLAEWSDTPWAQWQELAHDFLAQYSEQDLL